MTDIQRVWQYWVNQLAASYKGQVTYVYGKLAVPSRTDSFSSLCSINLLIILLISPPFINLLKSCKIILFSSRYHMGLMLLICHLTMLLSIHTSFGQSPSLICSTTRQGLQCLKNIIGAELDYYLPMMPTTARYACYSL